MRKHGGRMVWENDHFPKNIRSGEGLARGADEASAIAPRRFHEPPYIKEHFFIIGLLAPKPSSRVAERNVRQSGITADFADATSPGVRTVCWSGRGGVRLIFLKYYRQGIDREAPKYYTYN